MKSRERERSCLIFRSKYLWKTRYDAVIPGKTPFREVLSKGPCTVLNLKSSMKMNTDTHLYYCNYNLTLSGKRACISGKYYTSWPSFGRVLYIMNAWKCAAKTCRLCQSPPTLFDLQSHEIGCANTINRPEWPLSLRRHRRPRSLCFGGVECRHRLFQSQFP